MVKKEASTLERVYNVPLRREFLKVQNWRRTEKAVTALREFLRRHMKSETVKLSRELNEALWVRGIKHPPHHVKVTAVKNEKGEVTADLFEKNEQKKLDEKPVKKKTVKEEKKEALPQ